MKIDIQDNRTIEEIKNDFADHFPGLKIEFVKHSHSEGEGSSMTEIISGNPKLWELRKFHTEMAIQIDENWKVSDLEGLFRDRFGLFIQVFRKSGKVWLETVNTDSWTLKQQMERSAESSDLS